MLGQPLALGIVLALVAKASGALPVARWSQFRGPNGSGVCEDCRPPVRFGPDLNRLWKTPLPPGHSSPVVWDDHIFLTAVEDGRLWTFGLRRRDGQVRWRRQAPAATVETVHPFSSPAAPTPVTDGRRVYVYFGSFGLMAYDFEGREAWRRPFATPPGRYGTVSSPIIRRGNVILQRDGDSAASELLAVDGRTGRAAPNAPPQRRLWPAASAPAPASLPADDSIRSATPGQSLR